MRLLPWCGFTALRRVSEAEGPAPAPRLQPPPAPIDKLLCKSAGFYYDRQSSFNEAAAVAIPGCPIPGASNPVVAPAPRRAPERIKALHELHALDDAEDERFKPIVSLVLNFFKVDHAKLTLIDADRQYIKSKAGVDLTSSDRQAGFGCWALLPAHPVVLVVENALEDARFREHPLVVSPPYVRFYAAAPLVGSDGVIYGVLAIVDRKPRRFVAEQLTILTNFAEICVRKLEEARLDELQQEAGQGGKLLRDLTTVREALMLCNMATDRWVLEWANRNFVTLTGVETDTIKGDDIKTLFKLVGNQEEVMAECNAAIFCRQPFSVTVELRTGCQKKLVLRFSPASHGLQGSGVPAVGIPGFVASLAAGVTHEQLDVADLYFARLAPVGEAQSPSAVAAKDANFGSCSTQFTSCSTSEPRMKFGRARSVSDAGSEGSSGSTASRASSLLAELQEGLSKAPSITLPTGWATRQEVFQQIMDYYCTADGKCTLAASKHSALLEAIVGSEHTRHPCLVQSFDWGLRPVDPIDARNPNVHVRHALWVVLQLCNRGSLYDAVLKSRFRMALSASESGPNMLAILLTAQEIAGGMSLLHAHDVIHGDLSANNVLLTAAANSRRFTVAVSDFGLSRMSEDAGGHKTETVGTVTHQPPELLREGRLTKEADVYAYGVLLWSLYMGTHPFMGETSFMVVHRVVSSTRCPLELSDDAPAGYKNLFERCVSYDRTARPTFDAILEILTPMVEAAELSSPPPSPNLRAAPARMPQEQGAQPHSSKM